MIYQSYDIYITPSAKEEFVDYWELSLKELSDICQQIIHFLKSTWSYSELEDMTMQEKQELSKILSCQFLCHLNCEYGITSNNFVEILLVRQNDKDRDDFISLAFVLNVYHSDKFFYPNSPYSPVLSQVRH